MSPSASKQDKDSMQPDGAEERAESLNREIRQDAWDRLAYERASEYGRIAFEQMLFMAKTSLAFNGVLIAALGYGVKESLFASAAGFGFLVILGLIGFIFNIGAWIANKNTWRAIVLVIGHEVVLEKKHGINLHVNVSEWFHVEKQAWTTARLTQIFYCLCAFASILAPILLWPFR